MNVSLRQIRYFLAVAHTGQVSRAARDLNVSQSAVTTAVKQLEAELGCDLFRRNARGVSMTQDGSIFHRHALNILAAVDEAMRSPRGGPKTVEGTLRLAMTYTVTGYFLPPYLERFARSYPSIRLQLSETSRSEIEDGLVSGLYDLAVMLTSNIADQEGLAFETLLRSPRRLWLPVGHHLMRQKAITLKDVSTETYVMLTADEASNSAQRYWNQTAFRPDTLLRTSSIEAVRSLVGNGMGVTILSDMVYRPFSLDGRHVEVVELQEAVPTMDVGLAWAKNIELPPAATIFAEYIRNAMSNPA